ncbi:MAG: hypothetical protein ACOVS5_09410, partial [Oligoflexus sp.]
MADGDLNAEDFGLGSDFDDALAAASGEGDGGGKGLDKDEGVVMTPEDSRLARTDFSKLKMIL